MDCSVSLPDAVVQRLINNQVARLKKLQGETLAVVEAFRYDAEKCEALKTLIKREFNKALDELRDSEFKIEIVS